MLPVELLYHAGSILDGPGACKSLLPILARAPVQTGTRDHALRGMGLPEHRKGAAPQDITFGDIYLSALPFIAINVTVMVIILLFPGMIVNFVEGF